MAPDTVCQNLQATNALLARVACQLEQQTAELQEIRRATTSSEQHLSIVKRGVQQLVALATITAEACCTIALAAAEFLNTAATAQSVSRLQLAISSGRLVMLALLLPLCIFTSSRAVHKQCAVRHLHSNSLPLSWLPVPAAAKHLLQQYMQQPKQMRTGLLGLIRGSYRWCLISTGGCYATGVMLLLIWSWHSWAYRAPSQHTASAAAAKSPADPLLAVLLSALPVNSNDLHLLAVVLPAAVYQGALGVVAIAAVSGRWLSWLVLWEAWLACCCYSCQRMQHLRAGASSRVIIEHQQHFHMQHGQQAQQNAVYPVIYESMLGGPPVSQYQQHGLCQRSSRQSQLLNSSAEQPSAVRQSEKGTLNPNAGGIGSCELRLQLALAAVQLMLPAVMAVAAVCR